MINPFRSPRRFLRLTVTLGVPFGIAIGVTDMLSWHDATRALVAGFIAGALFGLGMAAFAEYQRSKFEASDPTGADELLFKRGAANHARGFERRGGYLFLTDRRLIFKSHGFNRKNDTVSIPIGDIRSVVPCPTLFIFPTGLRVLTNDGGQRFTVEGRDDWLTEIRKAASRDTRRPA